MSFWRELGLAGAGRDRHGAWCGMCCCQPCRATLSPGCCGRAPESLVCQDMAPGLLGYGLGVPRCGDGRDGDHSRLSQLPA